MKTSSPTNKGSSLFSLGRILIAVVLVLTVWISFMAPAESIREHQLYFSEDRKDVRFELAELSEAWTEKTLREKFSGIPINCFSNRGEGLGDRACVIDTKSFNGLPALFIPFFFDSGRLQQVSINVPWWKHDAGYNYVVASIGLPASSQLLPHSGVRLHGWRLPSGAAVFYNRDKSLNPLMWNAINWRSASSCATKRCFMR